MTALPDTPQMLSPRSIQPTADVAMRPNVSEHFWGYEVRANEFVLTVAALMRAACGLLTLGAVIATVGIWLMPQMAFTGEAMATKALTSALLIGLALFTARIAARGTQVRVQIDTANGELREVVDGPMKGDIVLARYGLDAVEAIEIVSSARDADFGQVQITMAGLGKIAAGDGAITALGPLVDRLAHDCGLDRGEKAQPAIWSGPLAA